MSRRLEPLACRIHDAVVTSGSDEDQVLSYDWYQKQAVQEPCPACLAIEEILIDHERHSIRPKVRSLFVGLTIGITFFVAGMFTQAPALYGAERWTTVGAFVIFGLATLWSALLRRTLA